MNDEDMEEDSEEEEEVVTRKRKRIISLEESSDSSEDEPLRQRLTKLKQVEQCDDIHDEELNFLDKSDILQERTRGKKVSRYSEALKKLADKKSRLDSYRGEKGPIDHFINDDDSDDDDESEQDDFIVDDDMIDGEKNTDIESEMNKVEMPAEFSSARTQSFSKQLSLYIKYLVELSLNPTYNVLVTNNKFKIAKNAVIRRVQSYKDSMVTSDVWLTSFKEAMDKYPNWILKQVYEDSLFQCDACRSNKPARYKVILCSDEIPSQVTLHIGSECCRKGQMYHRFYHFELHMYNKVKKQVVTEMMSKRFDTETMYAHLIETGFTKRLVKEIKDMFNKVNQLYNIKSQRTTIAEDTSSSSNSSSSSSIEYSSSEDS
ncbi:hypothetical protein BDF21DRAFT_418991 [Thamnidium elegans]|nr:hypothetical protein BDF21DRAFT_418991 [Thamnidium elegans]